MQSAILHMYGGSGQQPSVDQTPNILDMPVDARCVPPLMQRECENIENIKPNFAGKRNGNAQAP
jgi:hypothetical protein